MKVWRSRYHWTRCLCPKEKKVSHVANNVHVRERTITIGRFLDQVRAPRIAMEGYRPDVQGDEVPNHDETEEI